MIINNPLKKVVLAVAITAIAPSSSYAVGETANASFGSTVKIVQALTLNCPATSIDFGTIIDPASGTETVIVKSDGTHDTGTMTATPVVSDTPGAATCLVTGNSGDTITLDIDATDATNLDITDTRFDYDGGTEVLCGAEDCTGQVITLGTGAKNLRIGGTLEVNSAITPATYSSATAPSYNVTISYN